MEEIAGSVLLDFKKYLDSTMGHHVLEELTKNASEVTKEVFKGPILSNKKYPLEAWQEILRIFKEKQGLNSLIHMSKDMADRDLHGVFGLVVEFVSIEKIINLANSKFTSAFSNGNISIKKQDENNMTITITGLPMTEEHALAMKYYMIRLTEICTKRKTECKMEKVNTIHYNYVFKIY